MLGVIWVELPVLPMSQKNEACFVGYLNKTSIASLPLKDKGEELRAISRQRISLI